MRNDNTLALRICQVLLFTGLVLILYQYAYNRSLWGDESYLVVNIIQRDLAGLLKPLSLNQAVPVGFLFLEKLAISIFGNSEYALRFFPLLMHLAALPIFYRLGLAMTGSRLVSTGSVAFLSLSRFFIYYSSEAKQYSTDLFVAVVLVYLAVMIERTEKSRAYAVGLALAGMLAVWLSSTAVLVLTVCGAYLLIFHVIPKGKWNLLLAAIPVLLSFVVVYIFFIKDHPSADYMKSYWANQFWALDPTTSEFYLYPWNALKDYSYSLLGYGPFWPITWGILVAGTVLLLARRVYRLVFLVAFMVFVHLLVSGFELYPFFRRFVLYTLPFVVLLLMRSWVALIDFAKDRGLPVWSSLAAIPVAALFVPIVMYYPFVRSQVGWAAKHIAANLEEDDMIFIHRSAKRAYLYYQLSYPELAEAPTIYGEYHDDLSGYADDTDPLGGTVWLLLTQSRRSEGQDSTYIQILTRMEENGFKVREHVRYFEAEAYKMEGPE